MDTQLRLLARDEANDVYRTHLKSHFPRDEVKPWKSIERMWDCGAYFAVGLFDESGAFPGGLLGYAFFVEPPDCDACLLDYYAVLPEYRSLGLGGQSLQALRDLTAERGRYILLETEDTDFAKTEAQLAERSRRDDFYRRNGCVRTDVRGSVFGVRYAVWCLGTPPGDLPDDDALFDRVCADMQTLYRLMVPGEKNKLFIKIRRNR